MKNKLGIGDKYSAGDPMHDGLNERSSIDHKAKLRGETSANERRPTVLKGSIKSDRGSFKTC
jgi:hypothetical protein